MTAIFAIELRIVNQIPMSWARCATGLLRSHTILSESIRISKMLLASAKNGARGNAATNMVMKPNWITVEQKSAFSGCLDQREQGSGVVVRALASHLCDPDSVRVVGVWVEFVVGSLLAPRVFLRFSSLHKNQHFQFAIRPGRQVFTHEPLAR